MQVTIWTVGHSNHSVETFLEMLREHQIQVLVDIRRFPTSKIEHFKKDHMQKWLPQHGVEYIWLGRELGGYRRGGYQKHMSTKLFKDGIRQLLEIAKNKRACVMCKETDPRYCHRKHISTYLEKKSVIIRNILKKGQQSLLEKEHIESALKAS